MKLSIVFKHNNGWLILHIYDQPLQLLDLPKCTCFLIFPYHWDTYPTLHYHLHLKGALKDEAWKQDLWSSKNKSRNGIGHAIYEIGLVEEEEEEEEEGEIDRSYKLLFYIFF